MQTVRRLFTFFEPKHYTLELDLQRKERTFSGRVVIEGKKTGGYEIMLHAKALNISSIVVDDTVVEFTQDSDELTITPDFPAGDYTLTLTFDGKITDTMHGLYPCYFEVDGVKKELLATQFESHHAREVFPCVDEPEAKATFDLTLVTEPNVEVLSNMPSDGRQTLDDGRWKTTFLTTPRMSTYLLACVVGELQKKSRTSNHGVEVNVWSTKAQALSSLDFALNVATRAVDFYDDYFATPYPLPKADHVAIPDFSAGAMENWGLITYRESALLAEASAAESTKEYVASVVAHELSHQWFGNLVTMRWWNNLWLNESFARLMEYICVDALQPDWHVWDKMTLHESVHALRKDAADGVQAVQTDVHHPDEINSLFDPAIVYAKGARLLRMLLEYIGHTDFQKGLSLYFTHHSYKNTESDDLWDALSAASGKDVKKLMNTWISQAGYPVVYVEENGLRQERFFIGAHTATDVVWPVPLFANSSSLPDILETVTHSGSMPHDILLNTGDRAHFITHYDNARLAVLREQIASCELSAVDRLRLLHEQSLLVEAGLLDASELIPLLLAYRTSEEQPVWAMVVTVARSLRMFTETDTSAAQSLYNFYTQLVASPYERLGWRAQPGEPTTDSQLRADILNLVVHSRNAVMMQGAEEIFATTPLQDIDANIRVSVLRAVLTKQQDNTLFDTLFAAYKEASSPALKQDLMYGLASVTTEHARQTLFAALKDTSVIRPQDMKLWFMLLLHTPENRYASWCWLKDNWNWINETFRGDMSYERFLQYCGNYLATQKELDEFLGFVADKREIPALARTIAIAEKQIAARVSLILEQSRHFVDALRLL